jgi:hypothetical protein
MLPFKLPQQSPDRLAIDRMVGTTPGELLQRTMNTYDRHDQILGAAADASVEHRERDHAAKESNLPSRGLARPADFEVPQWATCRHFRFYAPT